MLKMKGLRKLSTPCRIFRLVLNPSALRKAITTLIEPISNARQKTGLLPFRSDRAWSVHPLIWPRWNGKLAVVECFALWICLQSTPSDCISLHIGLMKIQNHENDSAARNPPRAMRTHRNIWDCYAYTLRCCRCNVGEVEQKEREKLLSGRMIL